MSRPALVMSLQPRYAELLLAGVKTLELRRRPPPEAEGRLVFVYVSSPVRAVGGAFRIGRVRSGTPDELWHWAEGRAGVTRAEYDAYFDGTDTAHALELTHAAAYADPPGLAALRERFGKFTVPQSWRRATAAELAYFSSLAVR